MKMLPASLRPRNRYLVVEVISKNMVSREEILRETFEAMSSLFGDTISSECSIRLLKFANQKAIIKCTHMSTERVRAALATITHINGQRTIVHVVGISGTIKGATEKYINDI